MFKSSDVMVIYLKRFRVAFRGMVGWGVLGETKRILAPKMMCVHTFSVM
jgi:hypothetical protein